MSGFQPQIVRFSKDKTVRFSKAISAHFVKDHSVCFRPIQHSLFPVISDTKIVRSAPNPCYKICSSNNQKIVQFTVQFGLKTVRDERRIHWLQGQKIRNLQFSPIRTLNRARFAPIQCHKFNSLQFCCK